MCGIGIYVNTRTNICHYYLSQRAITVYEFKSCCFCCSCCSCWDTFQKLRVRVYCTSLGTVITTWTIKKNNNISCRKSFVPDYFFRKICLIELGVSLRPFNTPRIIKPFQFENGRDWTSSYHYIKKIQFTYLMSVLL